MTMMRRCWRGARFALLALVLAGLAGCSEPHVYGSIGVSSGYHGHGRWGGGIGTSISVGGRIF